MALNPILLTGTTGSLGAMTLEYLLQANLTVKAVLRSASKSQAYLERRYASAIAEGRLSFVEIPDMAVPNVFDAPAADVKAIMHIASPIPSPDNLSTTITTSDKIMVNILSAAVKSETVKRVIVTGSIVATLRVPEDLFTGITVSGLSWNPITEKEAYTDERSAYQYSKVSAEKAAWAFLKDLKDPKFDLVVLLAPSIVGRSVHEDNAPTKGSLGGQSAIYRELIDRETPGFVFPYFMDIKDVARIHLDSLEPSKVPGNSRYLFHSPEVLSANAIARIIHEEQPDALPPHIKNRVAKPVAGDDLPPNLFKTDTSKADCVFGTQWIGAWESVKADIEGILG